MKKLKRRLAVVFLLLVTFGLYVVSFIFELWRLPKKVYYTNEIDVMIKDAITAWNVK